MELIPILSTIILVATIATFILAVAAYILYKIRERRARAGRSASNAATVTVDTPVVMPGHTLVAPTPAVAMLGAAPTAVPSMAPSYALPANAPAPAYGASAYGTVPTPYGADAYGAPAYASPYDADPYGTAPQGYAFPEGYGAQGLPPLAMDTNADGRADTVYEPRPTYTDATGAAAAYTPAPDAYGSYTPAGRPAYEAPPANAVPPGSLFYELTSQGMTPVVQPAAPTFQAYPTLPPPQAPASVQQALAAEQQHREALGAAHARLAGEQARLNAAEDASRDRSDALRKNPAGTGGGLAWL